MPQFPIDEDGVPYCPLCREETGGKPHHDAWTLFNEIACDHCGDHIVEHEATFTTYYDRQCEAADNACSEKGLLDE